MIASLCTLILVQQGDWETLRERLRERAAPRTAVRWMVDRETPAPWPEWERGRIRRVEPGRVVWDSTGRPFSRAHNEAHAAIGPEDVAILFRFADGAALGATWDTGSASLGLQPHLLPEIQTAGAVLLLAAAPLAYRALLPGGEDRAQRTADGLWRWTITAPWTGLEEGRVRRQTLYVVVDLDPEDFLVRRVRWTTVGPWSYEETIEVLEMAEFAGVRWPRRVRRISEPDRGGFSWDFRISLYEDPEAPPAPWWTSEALPRAGPARPPRSFAVDPALLGFPPGPPGAPAERERLRAAVEARDAAALADAVAALTPLPIPERVAALEWLEPRLGRFRWRRREEDPQELSDWIEEGPPLPPAQDAVLLLALARAYARTGRVQEGLAAYRQVAADPHWVEEARADLRAWLWHGDSAEPGLDEEAARLGALTTAAGLRRAYRWTEEGSVQQAADLVAQLAREARSLHEPVWDRWGPPPDLPLLLAQRFQDAALPQAARDTLSAVVKSAPSQYPDEIPDPVWGWVRTIVGDDPHELYGFLHDRGRRIEGSTSDPPEGLGVEGVLTAVRRRLDEGRATPLDVRNVAELWHRHADEERLDAVLRQGAERFPEVAELHYVLGLLEQARGHPAEAAGAYDRALDALRNRAQLLLSEEFYGGYELTLQSILGIGSTRETQPGHRMPIPVAHALLARGTDREAEGLRRVQDLWTERLPHFAPEEFGAAFQLLGRDDHADAAYIEAVRSWCEWPRGGYREFREAIVERVLERIGRQDAALAAVVAQLAERSFEQTEEDEPVVVPEPAPRMPEIRANWESRADWTRAARAFAERSPTPSAEVTREVEECVERLAHDDPEERDPASRRLEEIGPTAASALLGPLESEDPEVAARVGALLLHWVREDLTERFLSGSVP